MAKKIFVRGLFVVLIVILVIGALVRTNDKVASTSETRDQSNNPAVGQSGSIEWVYAEGKVVSVTDVAMTVQAADGQQIIVENRPWLYALEQEFSAQVGDQIKLKGFTESGYFTAAHLQNVTNGKTVQLRDDTGRPGWSGRGRGSGG